MPLHMDEVIANSYLDFHAKGFSYLCLERTPDRTEKLYFFEGDVGSAPEVVSPHDHRYDFSSFVMNGVVENRIYIPSTSRYSRPKGGTVLQRFRYLTPLLGGNGFEWDGEESLELLSSIDYAPDGMHGKSYGMLFDDVHTIQIKAPETLLRLVQFEDRVPVGVPTRTFSSHREPPSLSGLYRKPSADDVVRLVKIARKFMSIPFIE